MWPLADLAHLHQQSDACPGSMFFQGVVALFVLLFEKRHREIKGEGEIVRKRRRETGSPASPPRVLARGSNMPALLSTPLPHTWLWSESEKQWEPPQHCLCGCPVLLPPGGVLGLEPWSSSALPAVPPAATPTSLFVLYENFHPSSPSSPSQREKRHLRKGRVCLLLRERTPEHHRHM